MCAYDELANPADLKPNPKNPNRHPENQIRLLAKIINETGWRSPIVVSTRSGYVVKGHGRLAAALLSGFESVPVDRQDYESDALELADMVADNRIAELAEMDADLLELIMSDLSGDGVDMDLTGFEDWMPDVADEKSNNDADDIPDAPPAVCQRGQVWQLGAHRLMCGSSTSATDVSLLMGGEMVDMVLTDPPYGVDYSSKNEMLNAFDKGNRNQRPIENDAIDDYCAFFEAFLSVIQMASYNTCYISMLGQQLHNLRMAFELAGFYWSDYLVWVKNNHVLGRKDYSAKHEFILYGWKGRHKFYGDFSTTVIEYARPQKSELHPTMKPVGLWERLISDGSAPGALVYDAFSGSGTTIIACENTRRRACCMEIDPHYCDVIIKRWEDYTGKKAVLRD